MKMDLMTAPQCCDCYRKFNSFSDNIARVLRLARKRTVDMLRNTAKCHDVPCLHAMGNIVVPKMAYMAMNIMGHDEIGLDLP